MTEKKLTATSDRRIVRRKPLKKCVDTIVRKGTLGLGPNLAAGGVELSSDGVQLRVKCELKKGDEIEIGLTGIGRSKPMSLVADVRWCREDEETDDFLIGAKFRRRLTYSEIGLFV
jgi:PilZ domain